jgi:hypothetical protein
MNRSAREASVWGTICVLALTTGVFMSRALLAILIVSALVLSTWHATAATIAAPTEAVGRVAAGNQSALRPGGASGIKEAQGIESSRYWRQAGLVIGAFVIIWLLAGIHESDDAPPTTGTWHRSGSPAFRGSGYSASHTRSGHSGDRIGSCTVALRSTVAMGAVQQLQKHFARTFIAGVIGLAMRLRILPLPLVLAACGDLQSFEQTPFISRTIARSFSNLLRPSSRATKHAILRRAMVLNRATASVRSVGNSTGLGIDLLRRMLIVRGLNS